MGKNKPVTAAEAVAVLPTECLGRGCDEISYYEYVVDGTKESRGKKK